MDINAEGQMTISNDDDHGSKQTGKTRNRIGLQYGEALKTKQNTQNMFDSFLKITIPDELTVLILHLKMAYASSAHITKNK